MTSFREILGQSQNSEISAILPYEISSFNFDLKFLWNWSFFNYEKKYEIKKLFSNLEPEGQGGGIIMGVTSDRAILHHTDQKGPNIMHPNVCLNTY